MVQTEDIIAGDAVLDGARDVRVAGSSSNSNNKGLGGNGALAALQLGQQRVGVDEGAQSVDVLHLLVAQIDASHPVDGLDVILHGLHQLAPVGLDLLVHVPAVGGRLVDGLAKEGGLVHQLLGDAANVDAGTADAPFGAQSGCGLHIIQTGHTSSVEDRLLGAGQTS